ncbi:undecaprenyldiphospho-muramoylpentapeptide beta-N-acetylglucosaminyltransferase [Kytococcus sp. Marseille-QA3725]
MTSLNSVVLAGGGTAGHVSPLIATADALRREHPDVRITAIGTAEGLEARLVPERGYPLRTIPKVPFPRRPGGAMLRLPRALKQAVDAAGRVLDDTGAQVVVGFGGYVSTPAYLSARRRRIPVVIHEQNSVAGLANRLGARMTPHVATTFSQTRLRGSRLVGMPLRTEITEIDRDALRAEALAFFGLTDHRPTVLVTGGSLGAARLNESFAASADALLAAGVQVLHLTGSGKVPASLLERHDVGEGPRYVVREYCDRMDLAYAAADLVVCRAGANTVTELSTVGLPAVFVPLPIGNGEQRLNATDVVNAGGGVVVDNDSVTPEWVTGELVTLATDAPRLEAMSRAASSLGSGRAALDLVHMIEEAVR